METLANGVKKPGDGDRGSVFWDALENNAQLQDDAMDTTTSAVSAASWISSGDMYRKSVSMPAGWTFGACVIAAALNASGHPIYPTIEKINASSFYLYMPFDNVAVDLYFTRGS